MKLIAERGYLIPAINTDTIDYVACAERLKHSILHWHPSANVTIMTLDDLPYGDKGGQANDWQVFYASPYRQTIKLEADMFCSSPIDHHWTLFENRDVVISQGCRDLYDQPSKSRHYRKLFDQSNLPDVYNAITYWRRSEVAKTFFTWVRQIFENWEQYKTLLKFPDPMPTTDVVYAMAATILGVDQVLLPAGVGPSIVHMKKHIIGTQTENWSKELVWEIQHDNLRINTVALWGLVHYQVKEWCKHD